MMKHALMGLALGLALLSLPLSLQGCASCSTDGDCPSNLRCGPGRICVGRCFVGQRDSCIAGYICDSSGLACVKDPNPPPQDSGTPEPTPEMKAPETPAERRASDE